ncbi:MAG TPA: DUF192 domain-containing protein [Burkholderiales bacterium]|nr:DUF192 domain-containing protein [Burkholderiales bacterium]
MILGAIHAAGKGAPPTPLLPRVWRARSAWERLRGLLGRAPLAPDEALLIEPCASVHTFGMRYPIDLAFLDRNGRVLRIVAAVKPRRVALRPGARATLEMAPGAAAALGLRTGDRLEWREAA